MTVVRLEEVLADLMQRKPECRIRIVGIDGPSGSGKSTVAARLALLGGAPIFEIDDFVSWSDFAGWWALLRDPSVEAIAVGG